jgi:hypothetical protein
MMWSEAGWAALAALALLPRSLGLSCQDAVCVCKCKCCCVITCGWWAMLCWCVLEGMCGCRGASSSCTTGPQASSGPVLLPVIAGTARVPCVRCSPCTLIQQARIILAVAACTCSPHSHLGFAVSTEPVGPGTRGLDTLVR